MSSLLLIGCGNMGSAMLASWKKNPAHGVSDFYVVTPKNNNADNFYTSIDDIHPVNKRPFPSDIKPDIIVFSVKPQQFLGNNNPGILEKCKKRFGIKPLYISIAAGKTIEFFTEYLGNDAKIIRAMPNTPALVSKAITALCASQNVTEAQKTHATALMEAFGKAIWVDEKDMNAVTAISGSGPAYVFLFLEAITKAGINAGLNAGIAKTLAEEMLHGSIHLVAKTGESFEKLRQNVTSKGGTTEAALNILMHDNALENLMTNAVQAAIARAKSLA